MALSEDQLPLGAMRRGPWIRLTNRSVYQNPWIHLEHHEVIRPDGKPGIYGVVHFAHHAVGVVPIDAQGYTWLVGQYRYPLDVYSWEIPEGGAHPGEDPLIGIQRELAEEAGLTATEWIPLGGLHTSNAVCNENGSVYLARGISIGEAHPDGDEQIAIRRLPFVEALAMAADGRITDCISIAGLFRAQVWLAQHDPK